MNIIIVGAGEVGYHIASRLASENKSVVVIDKNPDATRRIAEDLDVQVLTGSGSNPRELQKAGIRNAEIMLAVTDSDEINLIACLMTSLISPTTKKLARLRSTAFDPYHNTFKSQVPHIDTIINPETEVVNTIRRLMDVPGAVDVGDFADGAVKYVGIRIDGGSPMNGLKLIDFVDRFGDDRPLIAAIIRDNEVIVPRGTNRIQAGDLVYFICETEKLDFTLRQFGITSKPLRRALIVGGGRIGERLALKLESESIACKIIESDMDRCRELSERMEKAVILHGDGSDQNVFLEENITETDVVASVTGDDETNILVSLLVKSLGAQSSITRISKFSYFPLLSAIGIEKVVSPRLSAVSSILQDVRKGKILSAISVFGERAEFIEAIALETSDITNKPLRKLSFPKGAILICIMRNDEIIIPSGNSVVQPNDRIIMFALKQAVRKLEKLLTVKLEFF
ncbi:MAG: Trk system potassium transporter TrkA [Desulfobacteraceae bacterium]|nr:MAG: Trk system potassium transporter TrkA [Desulfobacteraceae bacterium]